MKSYIKFILFNAILLSLAISGFIYDVDGAKNVIYFYVWVYFFALIFAHEILKKDKKFIVKARKLPQKLRFYSELIIVLIIVYGGAIVTGAVMMLSALIINELAYTDRNETP